MELDLDAIEARHWHDESMRMCSLCMFEWPCDAVRMVAEVRRLRDENAALERKLNAALVDVVNMANEETAAAEAHEEALDRLRDVETLAREALAELDAQPELAHPDAVWYTGAALRDALEADRG